MKKILIVLAFLMVLVGCMDTLPIGNANPYFQGTWKSNCFYMKGDMHHFKVSFNSFSNLATVNLYKKVGYKKEKVESFQGVYWTEKDKVIGVIKSGIMYHFTYKSDKRIHLNYNGRRIRLHKN